MTNFSKGVKTNKFLKMNWKNVLLIGAVSLLPISMMAQANILNAKKPEEIGKKTPILGQTWRINFSRVHWEFDLIDGMYYRKKDNKGDFLPEYNWVWSPQAVINMHQPEKWGFVHFAKKIAEKDQPKFQYPDDSSLILWMYSQYRSQLGLINDSSKSKSIFPIKGSIESQTVTLEKIKYPNGYFLMAKSPKTNIVYYINEQGKLISKP